jgi:hypothetical protein
MKKNKTYFWEKCYEGIINEIICHFEGNNSNFDDLTNSIITNFNDKISSCGYHSGDTQYERIVAEIIDYLKIIKDINQCDKITQDIIDTLKSQDKYKDFDSNAVDFENVKEEVKLLYKKKSFDLIFLDFMRNLDRKMLMIPNRNICYSNEIKAKIDNDTTLKPTLDFFAEKMKQGESLIDWHSKLITNSSDNNKQDFLFNHWNIRHLHFNIQPFKPNGSANADKILLFVENDEEIYLLDIIPHPHTYKWTAFEFLVILSNNNWMEIIGFEETQHRPLSCRNFTLENNDLIYNFFKSNFNIGIFNINGKNYITMNSINAGGYKCEHSRYLNDVKNAISMVSPTATFKSFDIETGVIKYNENGFDKILKI